MSIKRTDEDESGSRTHPVRSARCRGASDKDTVETAQTAQYFKRNDSHYLLYEEDMEGFDGICKSRIKFRDNLLELTRQGAVEMHMIFEENKRHVVPVQHALRAAAAGDRDRQGAGRGTGGSDLS